MKNELIAEKIDGITSRLRVIKFAIDRIMSDEEAYMWNIPENLQESDRYYAADEAVDNLGDASDFVDDAYNEAIELLEELKNEQDQKKRD